MRQKRSEVILYLAQVMGTKYDKIRGQSIYRMSDRWVRGCVVVVVIIYCDVGGS